MSGGSRCILIFLNGVVIPHMFRELEEIDRKRYNGSDVTCNSSHTASTFWLKCRLPPFSVYSRDFSRIFLVWSPNIRETYRKKSKDIMLPCQKSPELSRTWSYTFNFILAFQFWFTEWHNNKEKRLQLRSILILCGKKAYYYGMGIFFKV